jgi:uncharacterized protein (DUF1330 family)
MGASARTFVQWFAIELADPDGYAEYRRRMTPVLHRFGGDFEYDLEIARVLRQPGGHPLHRVFSITFPDRASREGFFVDPEYRAIRAANFEPSVRAITLLGSWERDGS